MMAAVEFRNVSKAYGGVAAVDDFSLAVAPQSFTVLCGPPKSGKSVLFRLLMGLEQPDSGSIFLDGQDITGVPAAQRAIGYVPQSFALYPHLSVFDNLAYPMALARRPKAEIVGRVDWAAGLLGMKHLLKKTPDQLSGGEKQRAAVARGLLKDAKVFVLDDPLVGLDYKLRERLMDDLKALRDQLKVTFVYATSDSLEALTMAQVIAVLDHGRLVQYDDVIRVYDAPAHVRALDLIGFPRANVIAATVRDGKAMAGPLRFPAPRGLGDGPVTIGLRPEAIKAGGPHSAVVTLVENLGAELVVYLDAEGVSLTASYPADGENMPALNSGFAYAIDPADLFWFDAASGDRLTGVA